MSDEKDAHTFSKEELVQYLRDKGLSLDVLSRLKAFDNGKSGDDVADKQSRVIRGRRRRRKTKKRSNSQKGIRDPRRNRRARGLPPLEQNFIKSGSSTKNLKKSKSMVKSYSESRIDAPKRKEGIRKKVKHRREKGHKKIKAKKGKKDPKIEINRLVAGRAPDKNALGKDEEDIMNTLGDLLGKEKQAQVKNYYRKRALIDSKRKVPSIEDREMPKGAQMIQHGDGTASLPGRNDDGTVVEAILGGSHMQRRPNQLEPLVASPTVSAIPTIPENAPPQFSVKVPEPMMSTSSKQKELKSPLKVPSRPAGLSTKQSGVISEKVQLAEPPTQGEVEKRIASMPTVLEPHIEMELNKFLTSNDMGLGELSNTSDFIMDTSINALITIPNPPIRISLVPAPETSDIDDWREGCFAVKIRHDSVYSSSIPSTTKIPVSTKDWAKVLPDRRHPPCMGTGATSVLQLFVPREQSSHTTFLSGMKMSAQESDLVRKAGTVAVEDKIVKNLGGGGVHQTIEQPPPRGGKWDSAMKQKQDAADQALRETADGDMDKAQNPDMDPTEVASKVMDDLMNSKIAREKGLDKMISQMDPNRAGQKKMPSSAAEKFLSEVTDIIIHQIQSRLGLSDGDLQPVAEFGEDEEEEKKEELPTKVTGQTLIDTMPTQTEQKREIHGLPGQMAGKEAAGSQPGPQTTHFNQDITQGARKNDTTIGTALLSTKMAGMMNQDPGTMPATASVDPYNAAAANSTLNPNTGYGGPGSVTQAQAPGGHQHPVNMAQQPYAGPYGQQLSHPPQYHHPMQQQQYPPQQMPPQIMGMNQGQMPMDQQMNPMMMGFNPMMMMQMMQMMQSMNNMGGGNNNMMQGMNQGGQFNTTGATQGKSEVATGVERSAAPSGPVSQRGSKRGGDAAGSRAPSETGGGGGETAGLSRNQVRDLFTKALNNRYKQVEELFAMGVPPDTRDEHGNTCMHVAAQNGNKRLIKAALRWGADINVQNKQGQTPIHYLFAYKYEELAAYLISKGADDTIQNQFGYTCYDGLRPEEE